MQVLKGTTTLFAILKIEHSRRALCNSPTGNDAKSCREMNLSFLDRHQDDGRQPMRLMHLPI